MQALVTERMKPFLDKVIVSAQLHVYISQTDRGELVPPRQVPGRQRELPQAVFEKGD